MTDEEVRRAMEEGTPLSVPLRGRYGPSRGRRVVGFVQRAHYFTASSESDQIWLVYAQGLKVYHYSSRLRLATAEELLVEGDER